MQIYSSTDVKNTNYILDYVLKLQRESIISFITTNAKIFKIILNSQYISS